MRQFKILLRLLLDEYGINEARVREEALPDWWCNEFEVRDGAVFEGLAYICRKFCLTFDDVATKLSILTK